MSVEPDRCNLNILDTLIDRQILILLTIYC